MPLQLNELRSGLWTPIRGGITPGEPPVTTPVGDSWISGETKPTRLNSGAGIIAPYPTVKYTGPLTITVDKTVIENKVIDDYLTIAAADVVVRNCRITGKNTGFGTGAMRLVTCYSSKVKNARIEFCDLIVYTPSPWWDAIGSHDYTAYRNYTSGVVDAFAIFNGNSGMGSAAVNVTIEGNFCDNQSFYSPDPSHATVDNQTHNDVVQVQGGKGAKILGNNFQSYFDPELGSYPVNGATRMPKIGTIAKRPQSLSCVMLTAGVGAITDLLIENNWMGGGGIAINGGAALKAASNSYTIRGNKFDHGQRYGSGNSTTCITIHPDVPTLITSGNIYEDNETAVLIRRAAA